MAQPNWPSVQLHRANKVCLFFCFGGLQEAADTYLKGILGFEERPLVSTDYVNDARSGIVDAACTQVIDKTMVKVYVW
jgi:glyceraldehyde 3-phosphate dehydrogenase